jgi:hypothetical protein
MKFCMKDFHDAIEVLLRDPTKRTVTVFCYPLSNVRQRVRATRRHKPQSGRLNEILISYGSPNYAETEFLKQHKKAKCKPNRFLFKFFNNKG